MRTVATRLSVATAFLLLLAIPAKTQQDAANADWRSDGADTGNTRYSPLSQIDAANFSNLQPAWTPELHKKALEIVKKYRMGPIFTPPVVSKTEGPWGTLTASLSGSNRMGGSIDPETGIVYVNGVQYIAIAVGGKIDGRNQAQFMAFRLPASAARK